MKIFALLFMTLSFNAFSQSSEIKLNSKDQLNVICDPGTILSQNGNTLKCACRSDQYENRVGNVLKCESLCEIKVEMYDEWSDGDCGQGYCPAEIIDSYRAVVLKHSGRAFHAERIYSPRAIEIEMLVEEVKIVAKKYCFKTLYNGSYIQ